MRLLLLCLLLCGCAGMAWVSGRIRERHLAGGWKSERGDRLLIGCSGAFNADLTEISLALPASQHESGSHISEVGEHGFTVSRFPLASAYYGVQEWPHPDAQGRMVMRAEGLAWSRTQLLECD